MSDYDYDPKQKPSAYLRLKNQGDTITIRIASTPYRKPVVWREGQRAPMPDEDALRMGEDEWANIYREPDFTVAEAFLWMVIDREDGKAKIYSGSAGIYKTIKEYAEMPEWGDPRTYDFRIERTEEPGRSYYRVTPIPNRDPLTQGNLRMLTELEFEKKEVAARKLSERQIDFLADAPNDFDAVVLEDEAQAKAAEYATKKADDEPDTIAPMPDDDKPISLDDIPF